MACFGAGLINDIELEPLTEDGYSNPPDEDVYKEIYAPRELPSIPRKKSFRGDADAFRFLVLGGDDSLMNEACEIILGIRHTEYANVIRIREHIKTNVGRCTVSVLKTPFYWLRHLKSNLIFRNALKSVKPDMKQCESLLFPGPHFFLLVLRDARNSGKDLLLQAVSDVFGKQALDYCMVLFMSDCRERDISNNRCVKKCRNRFHVLENAETLLDYAGAVMQERENCYFTKDFELTERAKEHFQTEFDKRNLEHAEREKMLRRELRGMRKTIEEMRKENTQLKERTVVSKSSVNPFRIEDSEPIQFRNDLDVFDTRENLFKKELGASEAELNVFGNESREPKAAENELRGELEEYKAREILLRQELDESKGKEIHLRNYLDESKARANQFRNDLDESKATVIQFRKDLDESKAREVELNVELKILQSEIEHLKATEKDLKRNLSETKAKEAFLLKQIQSECDIIQRNEELQAKETELSERQRELETRERELETRERHLERNTWYRTALGDGASSDGDSHATGSDVTEELNLVRQNSLQFEQPNMSECEPSHNLRTHSGAGYNWRLYKYMQDPSQ